MEMFEYDQAREQERIWAAQGRFRMNAAATILAGMMCQSNLWQFKGDLPDLVQNAITAADELIKQLDLKYN